MYDTSNSISSLITEAGRDSGFSIVAISHSRGRPYLWSTKKWCTNIRRQESLNIRKRLPMFESCCFGGQGLMFLDARLATLTAQTGGSQ